MTSDDQQCRRGFLTFVASQYGTSRGLIRLLLSYGWYWSGRYVPYAQVDWPRVERLVFVCQGNVCRSPYAHYRALKCTRVVTSVGLSTTNGQPANVVAQKVAGRRGVDLNGHRAQAFGDFSKQETDLYCVMEDRHIEPLKRGLATAARERAQITLLGLWASPRRPLIYDPMGLSEEYFDTCYAVIDSAVANLLRVYRTAQPNALVATP